MEVAATVVSLGVSVMLIIIGYAFKKFLLEDAHKLRKELEEFKQALTEERAKLHQKGGNEANKEDLKELTALVKEVESNYNQKLEKFKQELTQETAKLYQKGVNEANKQDLEELTELVKGVENEYNEGLEELKNKLELSVLQQSSWYNKEKEVVFSFVDECLNFLTNHTREIVGADTYNKHKSALNAIDGKMYRIKAYVKDEDVFEAAKKVRDSIFKFINNCYSFYIQKEAGNIKNLALKYQSIYESFMKEFEPNFDGFTKQFQGYFQQWKP